ncbi:MAG: type I polyketide synthase, partial [Actinomycetota bacterium]
MEDNGERIAVVGLGAILPDAPTAPAFWTNVKQGRYSIGDVPVGRWDPDLYYDSDRKAPDKTYSKIGGWVKEWNWDPLAWRLPIPPRVGDEMDDGQKWAIACTREALLDYGYPERPLDPERTAVIIGNAMAGEKHYLTAFRIMFPELAEELIAAPNFMALPRDVQNAILSELQTGIGKRFPEITEDTMPGELSNILAGRVANLYNFRGPSFTTDAACASGLAAISAAVQGLRAHEYDSVVTGGVDRNMGVAAFVKFCKIGALSATGTRPYAAGADGFVMGEGGALFLLKRLTDAERDGDTIYAVIRSLAGSSDGKGKGITAPNPIGQRLAIERAWRAAGVSPETATLIEGHGTSTTVGDAVELDSLRAVFGIARVPRGAIALGSVKSNIGHLKSAAGAAGILKTIYALHDKVLPPSINFNEPNPGFDWASVPFRVNTELREWEQPANDIRRAGVSAFGFGGTNFHAVLEEYVPGSSDSTQRHVVAVNETRATEPVSVNETRATEPDAVPAKAPLRGAMVIGAPTTEALAQRLATVKAEADAGREPARAAPSAANLSAPERLAIDYADTSDLAAKAEVASKAMATDTPAVWKAMRSRGIFRGTGPAPKVAFLYTGQGSQYVNMLKELRKSEPIVAQTFADADRVMAPLLGKALSDYIFVDGGDAAAVGTAEADLMQTAITQPAVLATDLSLTKLLGAYGIHPDMVMGHSLGEYGALVAAGALTFDAALEAVSARGREMTNVVVEDRGKMAAIVAPLKEIERIVDSIDGYVVVANMNSNTQAVIGGASDAVDRAVKAFSDAGFQAIPLPVSHAFHTSIVAPASGPLREVLVRLNLRAPEIPIVANVTGDFYPMGDGVVPQMLDILSAQVASPVQFAKGLRTLYEAGARVFVEVGPKKALAVFADDVLGDHADVLPLFTNHPKIGDIPSFNQALCGLYAAGLGVATTQPSQTDPRQTQPSQTEPSQTEPSPRAEAQPATAEGARAPTNGKLEALFAEFLERARQISDRKATEQPGENERPDVVVTGAALGLPGTPHVFDDANVGRILNGEQLIGTIPETLQKAMLAKHITRLVKRENGDPRFETIDDAADVIKLAGRAGAFDLAEEFGVSADRLLALDRSTQLAIGAGIDALRDAGIPLVRKYRTTAKGTKLPEGWTLPEGLRDDTGVIFASAFPGLDAFADEISRYQEDRARREQLADLEEVRARSGETDGQRTPLVIDLDTRIAALRTEIDDHPYEFDRRFLFKCLSMGHAQFAEIVGARGPNTQINSACASTTLAFGLAEDWIRAGRCRRVLVVAADDATSDHMMEWIGAGFLASGAAATDAVVEDAATPFDRRRHGMLIGMGAAAFVVEREDAPRERGIRPICQLLGVVTANSAFHGSRLDVEHISGVMESLISGAETRWGIARAEIAPQLVFVSHETYTPARGGSAAAEVEALRHVFGAATDRIVVANTKGFTGHPMGVGIEDVVAVKTLETGLVPPVPNFKDVDPDLGTLNLSTGGAYPVRYALRLAAGFGSQISMSLLRWIPSPNGSRTAPEDANYTSRIDDPDVWNGWLTEISGDAAPELEVVQRALHVKAHSDRPAKAARDDKTPPSVASPVETAASLVETAPSVAVAAAPSEDEIRSTVLGLVAEKTGYPADMLELDLDLEADLGVDTVKQAEIFVALRETYGIPRDDALKLRDFPTLSHVIGFVRERAAATEPPIAPAEPAETPAQVSEIIPTAAATGPSEEEVKEHVLGLVAEKTGYPADMLELDLDLEADLGVDTVKQAEIFVALRETYGIPRDDALKLRDFPTLAHVIGFVRERAVAAEPPAAVSEPVATPAEQPDIVP